MKYNKILFLLSGRILDFQMKIRKKNALGAYFSGSWIEENTDK